MAYQSQTNGTCPIVFVIQAHEYSSAEWRNEYMRHGEPSMHLCSCLALIYVKRDWGNFGGVIFRRPLKTLALDNVLVYAWHWFSTIRAILSAYSSWGQKHGRSCIMSCGDKLHVSKIVSGAPGIRSSRWQNWSRALTLALPWQSSL